LENPERIDANDSGVWELRRLAIYRNEWEIRNFSQKQLNESNH